MTRKLTAISVIITLILLSISVTGISIKKEENLLNPEESILEDFLKIYDYKDITSPSSNHKASYKVGIKDLNDITPKTGPIVDDIIEFSTENFDEHFLCFISSS